MKNILCLIMFFSINSCSFAQSDKNIEIKKVVIDSSDSDYGYYLSVEPKGTIESVLVLFPGFSQKSESIFFDTEFHKYTIEQNILTIGFAGRMKLTADSNLQKKINLILTDVIKKANINKDEFVLGGFSAGGVIALRYTELCHQFPNEYPIRPKGVFMADSPVDLYHSWKLQEENIKNNYSEISVNEANWLKRFYREFYGATPSENPDKYIDLSPFSINEDYGNNEQYLKDVAVRAYHDIDIEWRLTIEIKPPNLIIMLLHLN